MLLRGIVAPTLDERTNQGSPSLRLEVASEHEHETAAEFCCRFASRAARLRGETPGTKRPGNNSMDKRPQEYRILMDDNPFGLGNRSSWETNRGQREADNRVTSQGIGFMTIADELQKLDELRRNGAISHEEFEIAKRKVLEGSQDPPRSDHLDEIKAQNELAQLDRQWALERENYMVAGRYGHKYVPGKLSSVFGGLMIVGFGIFWTVMAASMPRFGMAAASNTFPLFGVLFVLFGAGMSIMAFVKAGQHGKAQKRYQHRRREIQKKNRKTS